MSRAADAVFQGFRHFMSASEDELKTLGSTLPIPKFPANLIHQLLVETLRVLTIQNQAFIEIDPPFYVVGDLHGNFVDLLRIFSNIYMNGEIRIIFLGDYVDRGQYSLEVLLFLFALKNKYPTNIILLRGNHEFEDKRAKNPLIDNLKMFYENAEQLYSNFLTVFSMLPIAALLHNEYLFLHGGLSPRLVSLNDLRTIQLPINDFHNPLVADILWSDPCNSIASYVDSHRGVGKLFGFQATLRFMNKNNIKKIIRAHQCVQNGYEVSFNHVITVFSSSCYDDNDNSAAYLFISKEMEIIPTILQPFKGILRSESKFQEADFRPPTPTKGKLLSLTDHKLPPLYTQGLNRSSTMTCRKSSARAPAKPKVPLASLFNASLTSRCKEDIFF